MIDFVGRRHWYFLLSGLLIIPGLIYLAIFGLRLGIDFTGGSVMRLQFPAVVEQADLRQTMQELGYGDAIIQRSGEGTFIVRTKPLAEEEHDSAGNVTKPSEKQQIVDQLAAKYGGQVEVLEYSTVSPVVASEIVRNATLAVVAASVAIMIYLTFAFRKVPNPFRYGVCAVVALIHDTIVVLGTFAILGHHFGIEVDAMFITATLTVIGFSVHDTIVVFDRIRENLRRGVGDDFADAVNHSLVQTLGRSLNTSLTVILTLVALLLFGGVTIRSFVLVLLIGIISGTYSSIFNASQLLVVWDKGDIGRLWRRLRSGGTQNGPAASGLPMKA